MVTISRHPIFAPPGALPAPVPAALVALLRERLRRLARSLPVRDVAFAAAIVLSSDAIIAAGERLQDWVPGVLAIPDDAEIVSDHTVGERIRMFSLATASDPGALLAGWADALRADGYSVDHEESRYLGESIEFSGRDIVNAKIAVSPAAGAERTIIEFDATLN